MRSFPRFRILMLLVLSLTFCALAFAQEPPAPPPATDTAPAETTPTDTTSTVASATSTDTTATSAPAPATETAPPAEVAPAAEPTTTPAPETATAESADMATVIIYRPKSMIGMALHPTVMLDGKDLINVANGTVWKGSFTPGHYLFEMDDRKSKADLDLAKGETYYMRVDIVAGVWKGGGRLTQVVEQQGSGDIAKLRPLPEKEIEHELFKKKKAGSS